ncbi:MAG: hypothetical protein AAB116_11925 [Candidatus Poribacteria bacterium]
MTASRNIKILEKYIESNGVDNFADQTIKKLLSHSIRKEQKDLKGIIGRLRSYERKYNMDSAKFHDLFHQGNLGDDEDYFLWDAIIEMGNRIRTRIEILSGKAELDDVSKHRIISK